MRKLCTSAHKTAHKNSMKKIYTQREKKRITFEGESTETEKEMRNQIPDENIQIPGRTSGKQLFSAEMKKEIDSQR